jgi:Zn-finger protein
MQIKLSINLNKHNTKSLCLLHTQVLIANSTSKFYTMPKHGKKHNFAPKFDLKVVLHPSFGACHKNSHKQIWTLWFCFCVFLYLFSCGLTENIKRKRKKVLLCRKEVVQPHTFEALGSHKVKRGIQSYHPKTKELELFRWGLNISFIILNTKPWCLQRVLEKMKMFFTIVKWITLAYDKHFSSCCDHFPCFVTRSVRASKP